MILTGKCKEDFLKGRNKFVVQMLPEFLVNLAIYRWFNTSTNICMDIQHWQGDGFDYSIMHPYKDEVYQSKNKCGSRDVDFDNNLIDMLQKANGLYNRLN